MKYIPSALYNKTIPDLKNLISDAFAQGLSERKLASPPRVFFRADDIGVPSKLFTEMITLFSKKKIPLCLAVVPTWINTQRIHSLQQTTAHSSLFCWHQHGWLHKNHEITGKKQEFGPNRTAPTIEEDLLRGKNILENLFGEDFCPVFTPPWNRCSSTTIQLLKNLDFKGISRSKGATPAAPANFPDFQVNVDLHTRKEQDMSSSLVRLLEEIKSALGQQSMGVMLHHQRMNSNACDLLDIFLQVLCDFKEVETVSFKEMLLDPKNY